MKRLIEKNESEYCKVLKEANEQELRLYRFAKKYSWLPLLEIVLLLYISNTENNDENIFLAKAFLAIAGVFLNMIISFFPLIWRLAARYDFLHENTKYWLVYFAGSTQGMCAITLFSAVFNNFSDDSPWAALFCIVTNALIWFTFVFYIFLKTKLNNSKDGNDTCEPGKSDSEE